MWYKTTKQSQQQNIDVNALKKYTNRDNDLVSFSYRRNDEPIVSRESVDCYSKCMSFLPECELTLYSKDKSILPFEIFSEWIRLCQTNGLVVPNAQVKEDSRGNVLIIPQNNHHHQVYSSLCCFRWSENQPECPHIVVETKNPELDFFQVLHYALLEGNVNFTYHSFTTISVLNWTGIYTRRDRKEAIGGKIIHPIQHRYCWFFSWIS